MRTRHLLSASVMAMVIAVAVRADTNAPSVAPRTGAQVETELRVLLAVESKCLKLILEEVESIRSGLDRNDDAWKPRYLSGPPPYNYLSEATKRREALQEELLLLRSGKVQGKPRQQGAPEEFPPPVLSMGTTVCSDFSYGEMILSKSNPTNQFIGAELVTIAADSATLRVLSTGEYVSAKTNKYFRCRDFGTHGLLLRWVSKEKGQIGVERFGGTVEEQKHNPPAQATGKPMPDR